MCRALSFANVFSGKNAPVGSAMVTIGWVAEVAEWEIDSAFSLAAAFSMAACKLGKSALPVPRMFAREATACQCWWSKYDARTLRQWLMVVQAKQIGVQPCGVSPGARFPKKYLVEYAGVRLVAEECKPSDPGSAVFVGRESPAR